MTSFSRVALLGQNFADEEAREVGLVHEVREAEGFEAACRERLAEFAEKDTGAVGTTKGYLRDAALAEMRSQEIPRAAQFLDAWFSPTGRETIQQTIESLKR